MEIVENDHERAGSRRIPQKGRSGIEEPKSSAVGVERGWVREIGKILAQLREDLCDLWCAGTELHPQSLGVGIADVGAKCLNPRPVRRSSSSLPAAPDEDLCTSSSRVAAQLVGEPALADTGLAGEQEEATLSGEGLVETGAQLTQLRVTPHESAPRWLSGDRGLLARRFGVERSVLLEDRLLEVAQWATRLDPELLDEQTAAIAVRGERVGLPAGAIEGQHQLTTKPLAERVLVDEPLKLGDERAMPAERELCLQTIFERPEPQLAQPRDLGLRPRLVRQITQRVAPEQ